MAHSGKYRARIYRPEHVQQKVKLGGKLIGCTETVFTMYADAISFGAIAVSEKVVRAMSSEPTPDPASPGLNLSQMDAVAAKLHISYVNMTNQGHAWTEVHKLLDQNRRIQLSIWIGVNHSILLQAVRARPGGVAGYEVLIDDPLKKASGWVTDDWIIAHAHDFNVHNGGNGWWFAYSKTLAYVASGAS